jgi:hypothetical protein
MAKQWNPGDIERMMLCSTVCVCLLMLVAGSLWLLDAKIITSTTMGTLSGTGLLGIGGLLIGILKIAMKG